MSLLRGVGVVCLLFLGFGFVFFFFVFRFFNRRSSIICSCHWSFKLRHLSSPTGSLEAAQILCHPLPDPMRLGPCLWPSMFNTSLAHHVFRCMCIAQDWVPFSNKLAVLVFIFISPGGFEANHFIPAALGRECGKQSRMRGYCYWSRGKPPSSFPLPLALF